MLSTRGPVLEGVTQLVVWERPMTQDIAAV